MLIPLLPDSKPINFRYELSCSKSMYFIGFAASRLGDEIKSKLSSQIFIPRIKSSTSDKQIVPIFIK